MTRPNNIPFRIKETRESEETHDHVAVEVDARAGHEALLDAELVQVPADAPLDLREGELLLLGRRGVFLQETRLRDAL